MTALTSSSNNHLVDITPDVRLLRVLRNSGFNLQTAMGEILDNALDAGANQIDVSVFMNNRQKKNIMIVDNGKGMSEDTLRYSLTLAKEMKVGVDQLGKYGMGMKTASLSLSTSFVIFTKTFSGDVLFGEFNINKMERANEFKTEVRKATADEVEYFTDKIGNQRSGTVLIIQNCDRLDIGFPTFTRQMNAFIGMTYKYAIQRGITFTLTDDTVTKKSVESIDPLMRDFKDTYLVAEKEAFPVEYIDEAGKTRTTFIEVSVSLLPKPDKTSKGMTVNGKRAELTINQKNQGIYFYREGRMVGQALMWNEVTGERHNSKNRHRIEIYCKSELDDEIRMNHQKGNVSPTGAIKNQLAEILKPFLEELRVQETAQEDAEKTNTSPTNGTPVPTGTKKPTGMQTVGKPAGQPKPTEKKTSLTDQLSSLDAEKLATLLIARLQQDDVTTAVKEDIKKRIANA